MNDRDADHHGLMATRAGGGCSVRTDGNNRIRRRHEHKGVGCGDREKDPVRRSELGSVRGGRHTQTFGFPPAVSEVVSLALATARLASADAFPSESLGAPL
jgi:hypothetical protein